MTGPRHQQPGISPDLVAGASGGGELGARVHAELAVDLREIPLDGLRAQVEGVSDLLVRTPGDDELDDLVLRRRELLAGSGPAPDPAQLAPCALGP